jgi:hypothetical protein
MMTLSNQVAILFVLELVLECDRRSQVGQLWLIWK